MCALLKLPQLPTFCRDDQMLRRTSEPHQRLTRFNHVRITSMVTYLVVDSIDIQPLATFSVLSTYVYLI